jgi:hypothetical protein
MSDTACDVSACVSHAQCDIWHEWCKVWRYVHGRDRSPANAALVRKKIPCGRLSFDARGNMRVSPEVFNA